MQIMIPKCKSGRSPMAALRTRAELGECAVSLICKDLEAGLTQREVGAKVRIAQALISSFATGKKAPSIPMSRKIIAAYAKDAK
jgi:predicted transcriptional regulator